MKTTNQIIAETLTANKRGLNIKLWEKNGIARLYISNAGYNTKKMRTNAYIDLGSFRAVVSIECSSQPLEWISSQESIVREGLLSWARWARMIAAKNAPAVEPIEKQIENIETEAHNEALAAEPVVGYFTEWRSVRIAINRFGKLATRNRQYCVAFSGNKSNAPRGFVELTEEGYNWLNGRNDSEYMLEPYAEAPDFNAIAIRIINEAIHN